MSFTSDNASIENFENSISIATLWERLNPARWPFNIHELPVGSFLVGGAIRDALLSRLDRKYDVDLVVQHDAIQLVRNLAVNYGGKCVVLDETRDMARLLLKEWTFDFAKQSGPNLKQDLLSRDFTLNAVALTLGDNPELIDPTNGIEDLRNKRLVAIHERNLLQDPLRLIRGVRLCAQLGFNFDSDTCDWIMTHAKTLTFVASERIQSELLQIVSAPFFDEVMPFLKGSEMLSLWQNSAHSFSEQAPSLSDTRLLSLEERSSALPLARLTYLISDKGMQMLRFSRKQYQRCKLLRQWQDRNDGVAYRSLKERDRLQLHIDLEQDLPALILGLPFIEQASWLKKWRNLEDPLFHPASPLDGHSIQSNLSLPSGPLLGSLLRYLCHERAFGRLVGRDQALKTARYWLQQNQAIM